MSTQHTPGPWERSTKNCNILGKHSGCGRFVICSMQNPDIDQQEANARLIAAAPDYNTAARLFIAWVDSGKDGFPDPDKLADAVKATRAAIAKAEGRS